MKRIILFTIGFLLLATIPLIIWQDWFGIISQRENTLVTIILTLLELFGIIFAVSLVLQSIQYRRPRRFIFDGFSNGSELATCEKKPIDLNSIAMEMLLFQFHAIYRLLKQHASSWNKYNDSNDNKSYLFSASKLNAIDIYVE